MKTISGVIEGTAPAFVNTWKVSALCRNIDYIFEDSCAINVESCRWPFLYNCKKCMRERETHTHKVVLKRPHVYASSASCV